MTTEKNNLTGQFLAGGISCCIMSAILNPMDLTKVRLQTKDQLSKSNVSTFKAFTDCTKDIIKNEGVLTLWKRGLLASMLREGSYSSIRMGLYGPIRSKLVNNEKEVPLSKKILAGLLSGGLGSCFVNPTDVVKIRIQGEIRVPGQPTRYKNTFSAFLQIFREEGWKGLYKGVGATTLRAAILTGSQLSSYDHSKHLLLKTEYFKDDFKTHFTCALISGFVTTIATSPVDVIKTRLMNDKSSNNKESLYKNSLDCLIKTVRHGGITALYRGVVPNYFRLGPHFIFSLPLYEQLRIFFGVGSL